MTEGTNMYSEFPVKCFGEIDPASVSEAFDICKPDPGS